MKLAKVVPVALLVGMMFIASCANTVRGVGRDVNATADAVEDSVD